MVGRIVGGAGGLNKDLGAKFYRNTTFGEVVGDVLLEAAEKLDQTTSSAITGYQRAQWQRAVGRAGVALWRVVDSLNASLRTTSHVWRITRAGEVLLVVDTFATEVEMEHDLIKDEPLEGSKLVAPATAPILRPGTKFLGEKVGRVVTDVASGGIRQRYWRED